MLPVLDGELVQGHLLAGKKYLLRSPGDLRSRSFFPDLKNSEIATPKPMTTVSVCLAFPTEARGSEASLISRILGARLSSFPSLVAAYFSLIIFSEVVVNLHSNAHSFPEVCCTGEGGPSTFILSPGCL